MKKLLKQIAANLDTVNRTDPILRTEVAGIIREVVNEITRLETEKAAEKQKRSEFRQRAFKGAEEWAREKDAAILEQELADAELDVDDQEDT